MECNETSRLRKPGNLRNFEILLESEKLEAAWEGVRAVKIHSPQFLRGGVRVEH
jgi:hypothetical protein